MLLIHPFMVEIIRLAGPEKMRDNGTGSWKYDWPDREYPDQRGDGGIDYRRTRRIPEKTL
jgi:hypothetical protein